MATSTAQNIQSIREAIVRAHIDAEAVHHDVAATLATFRKPRYEVPALAVTAEGGDAVHGLITGLLSAFPDFHLAS